MMRSDPKTVRSDMSLRALRTKYPPGAIKSVYAVDPDGRYVGLIDMLAVHDPLIDDVVDFTVVADLAGMKSVYLLPSENVRTALARFEQAQTEALPVLSARADPRVVGFLTEAYALRRYTQELERRRSAELGEENLFSLGQTPGR
jgi:CIC family chloride channel protein